MIHNPVLCFSTYFSVVVLNLNVSPALFLFRRRHMFCMYCICVMNINEVIRIHKTCTKNVYELLLRENIVLRKVVGLFICSLLFFLYLFLFLSLSLVFVFFCIILMKLYICMRILYARVFFSLFLFRSCIVVFVFLK